MKSQPFLVDNKNIKISFTNNECYALKSGICSLEQEVKINRPEVFKSLYRNDQLYCPSIFHDIQHNGFHADNHLDEIQIDHYNDTNKYVVNEGRHRVCIAKKSGVEITAIVTEK
jgi:hypothetical protein